MFLLWAVTGCDYIFYYTLLPSDSNTLSYKPENYQYDNYNQIDSDNPFLYNVSPPNRDYYEVYRADTNHETSSKWYFGDIDVASRENTVTNSFNVIDKKFTIIVLPDTQNYTAYYPHIFDMQTEWIVAQKENLNITFVLHEGDLVQNNTAVEWERARASMMKLDGIVPYAVALGNHDIGALGLPVSTHDASLFNTYFSVDTYQHLSTFGGIYEPGKMQNSYHFFHAGGIDWLVIVLEFGPRDEVLEWALRIISYHYNRRVIILTHDYMNFDNTRHGSQPEHEHTPPEYEISHDLGGVNSGAEIWEKLIRLHKNISFVFSGHVLGDGTGLLVSVTPHGNKVYQILANYQMGPNGGNGFLRILEFDPANKSVSVKTFSPFTDKYKTDKENQFVLEDVDFF